LNAMKIHCQYTRLVDVSELKHNPKNMNRHSPEQIERLAKILEYQGWRYPVKVSNQSGFITSGHGRMLAALKMGLKQVPVSFQDYDSPDQEYADVVSDNSIASWAELDLSMVNLELQNLGPDFNIDLLGIKNFKLDELDQFEKEIEDKPNQFILSLMCKDETDASLLFDEMNRRGYECKIIR